MKSFSRGRLSAIPWTAAYQAPPSMGFSRQQYWSGVPLPSPTVWSMCVKYCIWLCVLYTEFVNQPQTTPNHTHRVASTKEYRIQSDSLTAESSVLKMHLILIRHYITIEDSGILKPRGDFTKTEISMDSDTSIGRWYYSFIGPRWRSLGFYKKSNN